MVLRLETCHVTILAQVTIQVTITDLYTVGLESTDSNYCIVSTQALRLRGHLFYCNWTP